MADLAIQTKKLDFHLEQVQDFTPTPMTVSTEIYATGLHPYTGEPTYVARSKEEKEAQRSFFFWYKPELRGAIRTALQRLGLSALAPQLLGDKPVKTAGRANGTPSPTARGHRRR